MSYSVGLFMIELDIPEARKQGADSSGTESSPQSFPASAKMTQRQVKEALRRIDAGEPLREIARSYNVSHSTISRLVT